MLLSGKLTGRAGLQITNPTLRSTWNAVTTPAIVNGKKVYQFALSSAAVERACGGVQETSRQIARSRFKVALASFEETSGEDGKNAGFEVYSDSIRRKAGDTDRWGTAIRGRRPGNGVAASFLSCERGSHRHTASSEDPASASRFKYCLTEEKLNHARVVMTDGEKKEKIYAGSERGSQ